MSNVNYTHKINWQELKEACESVADVMEARLDVYDALADIDDFRAGDRKVSSQIILKFKDETYVEFYDYKATSEYDDHPSHKPIEEFRKEGYEWHVQGTTNKLRDQVIAMVHTFFTDIKPSDEE